MDTNVQIVSIEFFCKFINMFKIIENGLIKSCNKDDYFYIVHWKFLKYIVDNIRLYKE